ncbi:RNA 2',3'-cyclic phosphodiesterase [Pseudomonas sp. zfem002]|uniref:RNA 2',3'-cyclic phosphodiesterase n=1 Tax=Pseudomonas sp. zfem002 TaxID=3078197 RepID=UPI0029291622|nr:RNA 2',3'-cyclic phosphodiesterase [Pseudomonas sp. zfem002]MDU9393573.1 RNA 2',3'-cyclic phosphodiesterase [Pseudomonas sp. zfem002]
MSSNEAGPNEPFKRLFFALPCTPQQGRALSRWRGELRLRSGRPVATENFHLTLMFLGSVGVTQLPAILEAAARLRPLERLEPLVLDRLEVWRRSQALVLTAEHAPAALLRWVYGLQEAMSPLGFLVDPREFRPHLTLMRDFRDGVPETAQAPGFHWNAREFVLYESSRGRYPALGQWPLADIARS